MNETDFIIKAEAVIRAAKSLYERGMINAFEGNVSVRAGGAMIITPSKVCKAELTPRDLVEMDIATGEAIYAARGRKASSEWRMHRSCYMARPDVSAVAHAHPPSATAFALRREPIESDSYPEMIILFGKVPVCAYGRPGTDAVCGGIPEALAGGDAFLLAHHGLTAVGASPMEAVYRIESIESIAKTICVARSLGGELPLPREELDGLYGIREANRGRRA